MQTTSFAERHGHNLSKIFQTALDKRKQPWYIVCCGRRNPGQSGSCRRQGDKFLFFTNALALSFGGFAGAVMRNHDRRDFDRVSNSLTKPLFLYGRRKPGKADNSQVKGEI